MDIKRYIMSDFSGCISVRQGEKMIYEAATGYRDLANEIPNTLETKFATASAGKAFVAVGILQLIEGGKLKLEDTIGKILDFDLEQIDKEITVQQLLNHTSGIPDYFDESVMEEYDELWQDYPNYKIRSSKDLLPLFIHKPMMYPRGERFQYNNTGFVILGLIIEAVTGQAFDMYLEENVFKVAGMRGTGYYALDRLPAGCANNYIYDETKQTYYTNIYSVDVKGTGAGGAFTTIGDVERFWKALLGYQLLSQEMTQQMLSIQSENEEDDNYGYGIWLSKCSPKNLLPYFTGCDPGVSFVSAYFLEKDINVTLVSNFGDNVWEILAKIREAIL